MTDPTAIEAETTSWSPATRVVFRFCFVYFGLYVLTTQMLQSMLLIPGLPVPDFGKIPPMRNLVMAVAHNILQVKPQLVPTGSGDTMYDWSQAFTLLLIALLATVAWSLASARRDPATRDHERLHKWFRLFVRFALGTTMLSYGFAKLYPLQMPVTFLRRLIEPFGDFSPMGVIWYSIGAAPGYERFIGFGEVLGGALLFLPRTALLGSLVSLGLTVGVFTINMTYDVPVKLFAFHLILFCLILIAPDAQRLLRLFILDRPVAPSAPLQFGRSLRSHRLWMRGQAVVALWLLGYSAYGGAQSWKAFGGAAPRSPLFGVWDVDSMFINGVEHPPLLTDTTRYSHAVFQGENGITLQKMNQSLVSYGGSVDTAKKSVTIRRGADTTRTVVFAYQRPADNRLILEGQLDGQAVRMQLTLHPLDKFLLLSRGFHWISEFPFNR